MLEARGSGIPTSAVLFVLLPFLALNLFFAGLGDYGLLDNNEGFYATIALEMLSGGDWITPHYDGLPYLEKPPLLFWLTAAAFAALGTESAAETARLVPALASLACVATTVWFGLRTGRENAAAVAGTILASSLVLGIIGRTLYFDMLLASLLSGALACAYLGITEDRRLPMLAAAVLLALATLAKGFMAPVLAVLILGVFLACARASGAQWRRMFDLPAILLYLAVAGPWHVAAAVANTDFLSFYIVNEHLGRALGTREPADFYRGPVWYYVPRLFLYLAPWTLVAPLLLVRNRTPESEPRDKLGVFLWAWLCVALAFFSFASNKANYYMVVGIVPLALLLARRIVAWVEAARSRWMWGIAFGMYALVLGLLVGVDAACSPDLGELYPFCTTVTASSYAPLAVLAGVAAFVAARIRDKPWRALVPVLAIAALSFPMRAILAHSISHFEARLTQREFMERFAAIDDGREFFVYSKISNISSVGFYLGRRFAVVDNLDADLMPMVRFADVGAQIVDFSAFRARAATAPVFLVTRPLWLPNIAQAGEGMVLCPALRAQNVVLLSNRSSDCAAP